MISSLPLNFRFPNSALNLFLLFQLAAVKSIPNKPPAIVILQKQAGVSDPNAEALRDRLSKDAVSQPNLPVATSSVASEDSVLLKTVDELAASFLVSQRKLDAKNTIVVSPGSEFPKLLDKLVLNSAAGPLRGIVCVPEPNQPTSSLPTKLLGTTVTKGAVNDSIQASLERLETQITPGKSTKIKLVTAAAAQALRTSSTGISSSII